MKLSEVFSAESIIPSAKSSDKESLFREIIDAMANSCPSIKKDEAFDAIMDREKKMTTGIMHAIAVPHGSCSSVTGVVGAIAISREGIDYNSLDKSPVNLVFMLVSGNGETENHLQVLKTLACVLQNPEFIKDVMELEDSKAIYDLLCKYEDNLSL